MESTLNASLDSLTPEQNLMNRYDEHFIYLIKSMDTSLEKLKKEDQDLVKRWIFKLSTLQHNSIEAKTLRNDYMAKLFTSILGGKLEKPFDRDPHGMKLKNENFRFDRLDEPYFWKDPTSNKRVTTARCQEFETYFSSKKLENGACAYIAVSARNDDEKSNWLKVRPNKIHESLIEKIFEAEGLGENK
jgi:hypothetical protein